MKIEKKDLANHSIPTSISKGDSLARERDTSALALMATHDLAKVDSVLQLKNLAEVLSAGIEVQIRACRQESNSNDAPLACAGEIELFTINQFREEFEKLFVGFLNPNEPNQKALINAFHRHLVGDEDIEKYHIRSLGLEASTIDRYLSNCIYVDILTISQPMVFALFTGGKQPIPVREALFRVWFNQIVALTLDYAASLQDQSTFICFDCLSKEPLFHRVRKVIRDFVDAEFKKASRLVKGKTISSKSLLASLEPLVAEITENTFVGLANELGAFTGNYIELRKPTETEIN